MFYEAFQKIRYKCEPNQLLAMYEMFIFPNSPFELNLPANAKEKIKHKIAHMISHPEEKVTAELFEEAAVEVELMLYQNSFPRFVDECKGSEFTLNASKKSLK